MTALASLVLSVFLGPLMPIQGLTQEHAPRPGLVAPPLIQVVDQAPLVGLGSDGRWVIAYQDESSVDLNGDGDLVDHVYAVHDLVAGTTANLGLAHRLDDSVVLGGGRALVRVPEFEQGADLNGDGDNRDLVLFAIDLASAGASNSGLAGLEDGLLIDRWAVFRVYEAAQGGSDLDANGSANEAVLFAWDLVAATSPVSLLHAGGGMVAHEHFFLAGVFEGHYVEPDPRSDLNGDGDDWDTILVIFDLEAPASPVNTQLTYRSGIQAVGAHSVIPVHEYDADADLNGDGDEGDIVLYLYDTTTGVLQNLGLALQAGYIPNGHGGMFAKALQLREEALVFAVGEWLQGSTDLNGDGDAIDSGVLFVHDFATGTTQNLGLSVYDFELRDGLVALQVSEPNHGADLDGDGDQLDHIVHVHRIADGTTWNLQRKTYTPQAPGGIRFALDGQRVAFEVPEWWEDDYNGDGDMADVVLFTADVATQGIWNHERAILPDRLQFTPGGALSFVVNESAQGADLDGDGTTNQYVFHLLGANGRVANSRARVALSAQLFAGVPFHYPIPATTGLRVAHSRL